MTVLAPPRRWLAGSVATLVAIGSLALVPGAAAAPVTPASPAPVNDATHVATDFSDGTAGSTPTGWTSRWSPDATLMLADSPRRAVLTVGDGGRSLFSFDAAGEISGDVEVAGLVRVPAPMPSTKFQMHLFAGGTDADTTTSYYLDHNGSNLRVSRYSAGGGFSNLRTSAIGFDADRWYNVVLRKELPNLLYSKAWPYGTEEPAAWTGQTTSAVLSGGLAGIGHFTDGAVSDWAWFAVATEGGTAQRAPGDLIPPPAVPSTVTGVQVQQAAGFATVSWQAATGDGTVSYEIARAPVDDSDTPTAAPKVVGVWQVGRTPGANLAFADAGFTVGDRYAWAVRAKGAGVTGDWSQPVVGTTLAAPGPDGFRTGWERNGGAGWTSYQQEQDFLAGIDAASERMRVVEYGRTAQGRALNAAIIGNPAPATAADVAATRPVMINCTVHGNEPAPREACLLLVRELSFSTEQWVTDLLATTTVLVVPTVNPDGREANTRGNSTGQDLNRDHSLLREPETYTFAEFMRDYGVTTAMDGHEYGNSATGDLPVLWPRNLNVDDDLWTLAQDGLVLGKVFDEADGAGWWPVPYPIGYAQETILRNTGGLKNIVSMLLESRVSGGPTRPDEGGSTSASNQQRRTYSQLWTFHQVLGFHLANYDTIIATVDQAKAAQTASTDPVYLDGARDTPDGTPPSQEPTRILDPAPCGYLLTAAQLAEGSPSVAEKLTAHGITVLDAGDGDALVPMGQPLRGLIPLLLDPEAVEGMVAAERLASGCVVGSTVTASAPDAELGGDVDVTVTVTSAAPVVGAPVSILEGTTVVGAATLSAAGTATVTVTGLTAGSHTLVARFAGSTQAAGSDAAPVSVVVYFGDAGPGGTFFADITWMLDNGITIGYADGTFRPTRTVTRQTMAAYLYRYANPGSGDISCTGQVRIFTDVAADDEFCGEIEWLASREIAQGYGDGGFGPTTVVTRQTMAAFLYRIANPGVGEPSCIGTDRRFSDVGSGNLFCGDIEWLAGREVIRGYPDGTFAPVAQVSRQAASGLLHRLAVAVPAT